MHLSTSTNTGEQCNVQQSAWLQYFKSNAHYSRDITPKRDTSGGIHLRSMAPGGQHSSEETSQRWLPVADSVSDLNSPVIELQTSRAYKNVFNN